MYTCMYMYIYSTFQKKLASFAYNSRELLMNANCFCAKFSPECQLLT